MTDPPIDQPPADAQDLTPVTPELVPTDNPLAGPFHFNLSVPEIEVRMVNASTLADYEVWIFAASASLTGCVGFLVAYVQSFHQVSDGKLAPTFHTVSTPGHLVVAVLFVAFFAAFFARAMVLRKSLHKSGRTYRMRATEAVEDGA